MNARLYLEITFRMCMLVGHLRDFFYYILLFLFEFKSILQVEKNVRYFTKSDSIFEEK